MHVHEDSSGTNQRETVKITSDILYFYQEKQKRKEKN